MQCLGRLWVPVALSTCSAAGAELDATKVLDALSEDMPLSVAVDIIAHMLRTAIHAQRSASIVRNLHRSLHLSTAAERAEVKYLLTCYPEHLVHSALCLNGNLFP